MRKYIKFGRYHKNYKYIILTLVFMMLAKFLPPFITDLFIHYELITPQVQNLAYHPHCKNIFMFLGMFIISFFLYKYEEKLSENKFDICKSKDSNSKRGCFKSIKKNEELKKKLNNKTKFLRILIIIIITCIIECLKGIISVFIIVSFWAVILLIIPYTNAKLFYLETYKHHKCSIIFSFSVLIIVQLTSFILLLQSDEKSIYKEYFWLLPIGIIIVLLYIIMISYFYSKMKWFMELNWISLTKLFMIYTLVGLSINIIICLILTFVKCGGDAKSYFCFIKDKQDNYYIENIFLYFEKISEIYEEDKFDFVFLVLKVLLCIILISFYIYFFFSTLKNLNLEYYYFSRSLIDILIRIIPLFQNKIFKGYYFAKKEEDYQLKLEIFLLNIIGDCLSIVGFLIYLEIIELNFCGFNYNLRTSIIERSIRDSIQDYDDIQSEDFIENEIQNKNSELPIMSE